MTESDARIYTVRWYRTRKCLARDADGVWRWAPPARAEVMTLSEAHKAQAQMGGIVCIDGVPLDQIGKPLPIKPKPLPPPPDTRLRDRIRAAVDADDWRSAFRLSLKRKDLGDRKLAVERALMALDRPSFCAQLKMAPDLLVKVGREVVSKYLEENR